MLPIEKTEFLKRIGCSEKDFVRQLCLPDMEKVGRVISLRSMLEIDTISPISKEMTFRLISQMKTMNGHSPFLNAKIQLAKFDPNHLKVGQRFAYRENLTSVLENLPAFFKKFMVPSGISELGAYFIFGKNNESERYFDLTKELFRDLKYLGIDG